jgi:hypothetical protein
MARFEKQYSDEQVAAARKKIEARTTSLRAAAAEIGCRPSTLSARITKAKAAEAEARVRLGIRVREPPPPTRRRADSERGARAGTPAAEGDPVQVLRGALQATKANGQPDWQIRVSAARTLSALPPEEPEPEPEPEPDSATLVYDLPPGSSPILHCAPPPIFGRATTTEPPSLPEPGLYLFQGETGPMIPLVHHAGGTQAHILTSHAAAADLLRAFGGNPRILDTTPDTDPQPNTP